MSTADSRARKGGEGRGGEETGGGRGGDGGGGGSYVLEILQAEIYDFHSHNPYSQALFYLFIYLFLAWLRFVEHMVVDP